MTFRIIIADTDSTAFAFVPGTSERFTAEQAEARAEQANRQAEALGIRTRYAIAPSR